jgi:phenylalanyl-tRNA synthetase beta chain
MKIVYSWLKDFVDINIPAEELADALTGAGLEVASIEKFRIPDGVKVAKVLATEKHPNADKLTVCKVDAGRGEPLQIVCGAPNVRPGLIVSLATEGTVIAPDFIIKKSKLRGVESFGMLCSAKELGISEDNSGIMENPESFVIGKDLSLYYPEDAVIEIEITPDRGYCLSILGVAREVSARFGLPIRDVAKKPVENAQDKIDNAINITVTDSAANPRYMGRLVRNVKITESPEWMKNRLSAAGLRPINNIVDITNYILIQYGQPMHAFDYDTIADKKIIVKRAGSNQKFATLDNVERDLIADDLLICDGKRAVALAGVMGGAGSEISDTTTNVFLECAFFDPVTVRKTSKRLGLSTDSSYRFERGVDPDTGLVAALETAAALMQELGGGQVASGIIDNYPVKLEKRVITVRPSKVSRVLGIPFTMDQIELSLSSLGINCTRVNADTLKCTVPLFRHDITIEEDLIEEVGRLYGYDNIPPAESAVVSLNTALPMRERLTDLVRGALAHNGLNEIITNSLAHEKRRIALTPNKTPVKLLNPLNPDMAEMRTTLAGSMLEILAYNLNRKNVNNHFFELGKTFERMPDMSIVERDVLGIIIEGATWGSAWNNKAQPADFFTLKGILDTFALHIGLEPFTYAKHNDGKPIFGSECASLVYGKVMSGLCGLVSSEVKKFFDIKSNVYYAEIDVTELLKSSIPLPKYKPLPKFPALERDFCFVMSDEICASSINDEISKISPLIENVHPFDLYRGEKLGAGKKSIAFSVKIRSAEKTLTDKDSELICTSIVDTMKTRYNAVLRT